MVEKLSDLEARLMLAFNGMAPDYCRTFKGIETRCDVPSHLIRRVTRACARKGLLEYHRGLWSDDGTPAGAGYGLTLAGEVYLDSTAPLPPPPQEG